MLNAISPVDGRYEPKTRPLQKYFSEAALIRYRIRVEMDYFYRLFELGVVKAETSALEAAMQKTKTLSDDHIARVKEIERVTNHDVKAVEYFIKEILEGLLPKSQLEFIHFGLTSQDINNTALPLMIKEGIEDIVLPEIEKVLCSIEQLSDQNLQVPMLARTHGQPASPTTLGKEMLVFADRLKRQHDTLRKWNYWAKFGGATGNFNAHLVAYPQIDWRKAADELVEGMGLKRHRHTTQIDHYDDMAALFHLLVRMNNILIDFCRDVWTYISMNYFIQKVVASEVGSSAMPHKVNPIDFENAEGNLAYANAIFEFLASKLPISRLQRDLTDSTVTRNIGVPLAHTIIALSSIERGIKKLEVNKNKIAQDLEESWAVVAEGIQTVLRREGIERPYEQLKAFSRGKGVLTAADFDQFIESLNVSKSIKDELRSITPHNYLGYSPNP